MKTILFLAANPKETSPLNLDVEVREIDSRLRKSNLGDKFILSSQWAVQIDDIQEHLLRYRPSVVHFSGHGGASGELIFLNQNNQGQAVSIKALENLFSILKDNIKCVVLNACYSEAQAKAIAQHIDCVVGMSRAISDVAAIRFASSFYQALGFGKSIKTAFDLGCSQIDLIGLNEIDTPKLISLHQKPEELFFHFSNEERGNIILENNKLPQDLPETLKGITTVDNFIDIPISKLSLKMTENQNIQLIYLILNLRNSPQKYVVRVPMIIPIKYLSKYLVNFIFPHVDDDYYNWTIVFKGEHLFSELTVQSSGLSTCDHIYLIGQPFRNEWAPSLR